MHCIIPAHLIIGDKNNKVSRDSVGHALKTAEIHRLVAISVSQFQMILRGEKSFPIEPTPSMYKNPRGQLSMAIPALSPAMPALSPATPSLSMAMPALSPAMPALSPATPSLSMAMPALSPAMPALSPAFSALPPVVGLDDWSLTLEAIPMLNYDENDMNVEIVAEENYMDIDVAEENNMEAV